MSRIRSIKPEFAEDEITNGKLTHVARLAYILSWPLCDDCGRMRGSKAYLKANLFPYDTDPAFHKSFDAAYDQLIALGKWVSYQVNGQTYIYLPNFRKHQRIDKPSPSRIPPPTDSPNTPGALQEASANAPGTLPVGVDMEADQDQEGMGKDRSDAAFDAFWELYPRKAAKPKAAKSWRTEVRKRDIAPLMADVERRCGSEDWTKKNGKYIPLPATYLNQRRWEDQGVDLRGDDCEGPEPDWAGIEANLAADSDGHEAA